MIHIVFSSSACGSLKMAQHYGKGTYHEGSIGIIIGRADGSTLTEEEVEKASQAARKKARLAWENATPMAGKTSDIYGFNLMLSIGDISEDQPGIKRKQTLEHLYSIYPNDEGSQVAEELITQAVDDLKLIQQRVTAGESLRIWYSNQPDELCGLYWFMRQLNQWNMNHVPVSVIKLPEWETNEPGTFLQRNSWGEVAPEEWQRHLALQKTVPPVFIHRCASHWQQLQAENTPLRALLNGRLVGMPETLYDDFILREIAAEGEEFQEAMIIGRVLGKYQLGISDVWVADRIEKIIRAGKIEIVSTPEKDMPVYHRILRKRQPETAFIPAVLPKV